MTSKPWFANNNDTPTRAEANRDEAECLPTDLTLAEQEQVASYFTEYRRLLAQIGGAS